MPVTPELAHLRPWAVSQEEYGVRCALGKQTSSARNEGTLTAQLSYAVRWIDHGHSSFLLFAHHFTFVCHYLHLLPGGDHDCRPRPAGTSRRQLRPSRHRLRRRCPCEHLRPLRDVRHRLTAVHLPSTTPSTLPTSFFLDVPFRPPFPPLTFLRHPYSRLDLFFFPPFFLV